MVQEQVDNAANLIRPQDLGGSAYEQKNRSYYRKSP